jgi:hypothetical protein
MSHAPESLDSLAGLVERVARIAGDVAVGYYKTSLLIES